MTPRSSGLIDMGGGRYVVPAKTSKAELRRLVQELDRRRQGKTTTRRRPPGHRWKRGGGVVEYEPSEEEPSPGRVRRIKGGE